VEPALRVKTSTGVEYPVFCGGTMEGFLDAVWAPSWKRVVVVGDEHTLPLFGEPAARHLESRGLLALRLSFPAGEQHKTRATKERLEDAMLEAGVERSACLLAVGGGIALDVAGFVAATYMRGIPFVSLATSLLAQVDASIGGKTGVNTRHGKNLVGAFHQPRAVWLATPWLATLPEEEARNGWAEAIKQAVISDAALFARIEEWALDRREPFPEALVLCSAERKAQVVGQDEYEQGLRQILNFGHTVGHALELATSHALSHGRAVALGMAVEARVAQRLCGFPAADGARLERLLDRLGLLGAAPCSFESLARLFGLDKKTRDAIIHCALPRRIGEMTPGDGRWAVPVSIDELRLAWEQWNGGDSCCA